jgi:ABC-type transporter Mla maintaining outer membrane lipid asymmetry ATPase subunit MlaF
MNEILPRPLIEMRGVSVGAMREPAFTVLENVDWAVAPGEFWVVAGPPQSGKSDLLMLAAGLMPPQTGRIQWWGAETPEAGDTARRRVGLVFEGGQLFNQLTLAENIALPLRYHHNLTADAALAAVKPLLDGMELTPLADVAPPHVAANWRVRAALARALALQPELLLLDNPLTGLGTRHVHWWRRFLDQLRRGHQWLGGRPLTMVLTTDDLSRLADWDHTGRRFALLRDKQFIPLGSWREVETSADPALKELLAETEEQVKASSG